MPKLIRVHVRSFFKLLQRQKELTYTLKRLIRGCGASTNISRAGFFTGLVGFLKAFSHEEITMQQVFDTLNKELHVGATIANKEDADAVVGKILVCGALLHAGRLTEANSEYLEQVTNVLLQSTHHRTYHASLGYSFLCEIIENVSMKIKYKIKVFILTFVISCYTVITEAV